MTVIQDELEVYHNMRQGMAGGKLTMKMSINDTLHISCPDLYLYSFVHRFSSSSIFLSVSFAYAPESYASDFIGKQPGFVGYQPVVSIGKLKSLVTSGFPNTSACLLICSQLRRDLEKFGISIPGDVDCRMR